MNDVTIEWTGERMPNAGLLYQAYLNRGRVIATDGTYVGEVLEVPGGKYQARITGIMADNEYTSPVSAALKVFEMYREFGHS